MAKTRIIVRPGTAADSRTAFRVFDRSVRDLSRRLGIDIAAEQDAAGEERSWQRMKPLYDHLAEVGRDFWVAERNRELVGYARSRLEGDLLELTEFFVVPGRQSSGLGKALLSKVYNPANSERRVILASPDVRAQALYLKSGHYPRFTIYYFYRQPEVVEFETDLSIMPVSVLTDYLDQLALIDEKVLGLRRDRDHQWLLATRNGYLYYRDGKPVGYGYAGYDSGPFALLDETDFPAVLAHAETVAATEGIEQQGLEVPMVNRAAVDFLIGRGYHFSPFVVTFMSNKPFGAFEKYIHSRPLFVL